MRNEKIDKFVNLHVHSALGSLLDSVAKIPDIVKFAKEHNQIAVALTDHGKMSGFVELYKECKKAEIKPIIGIEAYEVDDMYEKADTKEYTQPRYHLLLLAKNKIGLQNLFKIATISNTEGFYKKPLITLDYIKEHNLGEGVICSSACLASRLSRALENDDWELAEKVALKTKSIFEDYYIEMQSHANDIQMTSNIKHLKLAKKLNIPWLISTDAHMITEDQMDIHSVFIRISQDREVGENYDGCYLQTSTEVVDKFHKYEHFGFTFQDIKTGVLNTFKIANEVEDIDIGFHQENQMPKIDIPKEFKDSNEYVEHLIWKGFEEKFKDMSEEDKEIRRQRLNEEIPVIEALHYSDYFIMLQMLTQEAKKRKIPLGYSRGSGANCLCLYCLGITQIDSVRWNLDFSRFANLGRISMADYDMDISKLRRKEMVSISEDLFGKENVAPICTFNTLSTKVAIRDIGKVLNEDPNSPYYNQIPYNIRDEVAKQIPTIKTLDDLGQEVEKDMLLKDLLSSDPKLQEWYHRFPKWFYYVMYLEGLPKSMGRHAAGTIIAPKPCVEYAPLCLDTEGNIIFQLEMHSLMEDLSLIKMDFLGLETLDIVDEALNIAGLTWEDVDINHLNLADKEVYANIYKKGNTVSIFQMESAEARNMCIEAKADNIEDIIAINAANRPGTKDQFPDYCRNKLNPESATLIHPDLGEIFKTTNMILLYQEQALQIFRYAGFPENEVDNARRCVDENTYILMWNGSTKKIKDLKVGDKILNLGENNNIVVDTVKQVFDNGLQDTFEVRAQQTKSIIGTKDHKVLTQDGWKTIGELTTSDYVMIPKYCPNIRNNIPSNKYPCSESLFSIGALIGDGALGDKTNIHFTNSDEELSEVYCPQTYTLLRAEYIPVKVTSIKPYKKTHVYDLEATNNHNYIANDIIVHNCIGKKLKDKMKDLEVEFRDLLTKKGWTEQQINDLWDLILKQTGYSFNRGHSVSYGLLSYLTAYLKYHYPVEFMTACLNVKADNISKIGILINECYNLNIEVLPPDINKSRKDFTAFPKNRQILFGLLAIKGLGDSMLSVALENRPYKDFLDFLQRSKATSKVVINFIKAGCFGKNKKDLLLQYFDYTFPDRVFKPTKTLPKAEILLNDWGIEKGDRTNKDESLIREYNDKRKLKFDAEQKEKYNLKLQQFKEKYMQNEYMWEFETLSMFITDNPLKEMSHYITDWNLVKDGEEPCILAVIVDIKRKKDKNNNVFAYLDLYTVNGIIEAIAWSSKYKKYSNLIEKGKCISILGRKNEDKIFVNEIKSFEQWKKDRFIEEEN